MDEAETRYRAIPFEIVILPIRTVHALPCSVTTYHTNLGVLHATFSRCPAPSTAQVAANADLITE
jgi:hypothetical protein